MVIERIKLIYRDTTILNITLGNVIELIILNFNKYHLFQANRNVHKGYL